MPRSIFYIPSFNPGAYARSNVRSLSTIVHSIVTDDLPVSTARRLSPFRKRHSMFWRSDAGEMLRADDSSGLRVVRQSQITTTLGDLADNANSIVFKNAVTAFLLRHAMLEYFPPADQRRFIISTSVAPIN